MEEGVEIEKGKIDDLTGIAARKLKIFMISPRISLKVGKSIFKCFYEIEKQRAIITSEFRNGLRTVSIECYQAFYSSFNYHKTPTFSEMGAKLRLRERILQSFLIRK